MDAPPLGSIGLVRVRGVVGASIRLGQWLNGDGFHDFEHAFVAVGNDELVEAEPGGARVAPLSSYEGWPTMWLPCPIQFGPDVALAGRQLIGVPYSALDYLALAMHRLHIPAPGLRGYISSTGHMICSQLADFAAAKGGWHLFSDGRWPGYVTPGALRALAAQQPLAGKI